MPKTYTVKQVADILGYSTNSIYTFLKEKRLKGVRVGKGRFRIPETELARVLHLSKKSVQSVSPVVSQPVGDDRFIEETEPATLVFGLFGKTFSLPNIFDWFVGLSAITSGVALFLFNHNYQIQEAAQLSVILSGVRIMLIAAGVGILLSDILPKAAVWHRMFLFIFSLLAAYQSFTFFRIGDFDGALFHGLLAVTVGVNVIVHLGGIFSLSVYLVLLALAFPSIFLWGQTDLHAQTILNVFHLSPLMAAGITTAMAATFVLLFFIGYRLAPLLFWIITWFAAAILILLSILNAQLLIWSRSFFFLTLSFFSAFLPVWRILQYTQNRKERLLIHGMFGVAGLTMIVAIAVVGIMQSVVWEQNRDDFQSKMSYAKTLVNTSLESVESTVVTASTNPELLTAVGKKDEEYLSALSRVIYESNSNIRRLMYLDADGNGVALYPYGTFDQLNFAYREYFQKVRDTGKPYISNIFETQSDQEKRKVIVIAVPLKNSKGTFLGVMIASVNLLGLGERLQQVAVAGNGEYFLMVDEEGNIIVAPETTQIGTPIAKDDPLRKGMEGKSGTILARMNNGILGMVAYDAIEKKHWALSLRAPANQVYAIRQSAIASVFGIVGVAALSGLAFLLFVHVRLRKSGEVQ